MPNIGHTVSLSLSPSLSISVPHKSNEDWKRGNLIFFLLFSFFTVHQFHFLDGALCRSIHCRVSSDISPKVPNTSDCSMCQPHSMGSLGPSDGSSLYVCGHLDSPWWRWIIIFTNKNSKFLFSRDFFLQIFNLTYFSGQTCNIFWPDGKGNSENDNNDEDDQNYLFSNATDTDYESSEGSRNFSPRAFTIYSLVLGFAIPLSLILIFYAQVVFKLRTVGELSLCVKQALISNSIKMLFYLSL